MSPLELILSALFLGIGLGTFAGVILWMCYRGSMEVIIECCECGTPIVLGTAEQFREQGGLSHGFCPACYRAKMAEVDNLLAELGKDVA